MQIFNFIFACRVLSGHFLAYICRGQEMGHYCKTCWSSPTEPGTNYCYKCIWGRGEGRTKAQDIFDRTKERALRDGIEFNLTEEDFVIPTHCPVLGIKILARSYRSNTSPSIDRIDNSKGYIKGNVAIISWRANRLKNDGTADEHERIAQWMRERLNSVATCPQEATVTGEWDTARESSSQSMLESALAAHAAN